MWLMVMLVNSLGLSPSPQPLALAPIGLALALNPKWPENYPLNP